MILEERLKLIKERGYKYNSETGQVLTTRNNILTYVNSGGYLYINTGKDKKNIGVSVHQFVWYVTYDEVPTLIDHIDRNKLNNKIENLRLSNKSKNMRNCEKTDNAKGYRKNYKKFTARIQINNKYITIGNYYTEEEAHQAYLEYRKNI